MHSPAKCAKSIGESDVDPAGHCATADWKCAQQHLKCAFHCLRSPFTTMRPRSTSDAFSEFASGCTIAGSSLPSSSYSHFPSSSVWCTALECRSHLDDRDPNRNIFFICILLHELGIRLSPKVGAFACRRSSYSRWAVFRKWSGRVLTPRRNSGWRWRGPW